MNTKTKKKIWKLMNKSFFYFTNLNTTMFLQINKSRKNTEYLVLENNKKTQQCRTISHTLNKGCITFLFITFIIIISIFYFLFLSLLHSLSGEQKQHLEARVWGITYDKSPFWIWIESHDITNEIDCVLHQQAPGESFPSAGH